MEKRGHIKTYHLPIAGRRCTIFSDVYISSKDLKSDASVWFKADRQFYKPMIAVPAAIGFEPPGTQRLRAIRKDIQQPCSFALRSLRNLSMSLLFRNISATKAERHEETLRFLKPYYPFVHLRAIVSLWRDTFF
ncbi:hypothetical protein [Niabella sp.]|uniref:hypothetical protein n=1 Tax=Niabella sp. TaxID=1962976 RepID=UPI00261D4931|nr:hypothetical protein [Niabella sp.]